MRTLLHVIRQMCIAPWALARVSRPTEGLARSSARGGPVRARRRTRRSRTRARKPWRDAPDTADERRHVPSEEGTRWTDHLSQHTNAHDFVFNTSKHRTAPTPHFLFAPLACVSHTRPGWLAACRNHLRKACFCNQTPAPSPRRTPMQRMLVVDYRSTAPYRCRPTPQRRSRPLPPSTNAATRLQKGKGRRL